MQQGNVHFRRQRAGVELINHLDRGAGISSQCQQINIAAVNEPKSNRCVALEASPHQVTVNAICPGFVETDMLDELRAQASTSAGTSAEDFEKAALARVPLGRMMRPEEIASMAVFLASKNATGMTGQSIHMDGGMVL